MSRKWIAGVAALVVVGAGGVTAAIVTAADDEQVGHAETTLDVRVSGDASGAALSGVRAHASAKTKITYPTGEPQTVPGGTSAGIDISKCPRKSKVLNYQLQTSRPGPVPAESFPVSNRAWHLTLDDLTPGPDYEAVFGLVCAKSGK
jgi:hypothetical protein